MCEYCDFCEDVERLNEKLRIKCDEIAELRKQIPVWHKVSEKLPEGNPMLPALTVDGLIIYWGNWHDCDFDIYGITQWCELPTAPKDGENGQCV